MIVAFWDLVFLQSCTPKLPIPDGWHHIVNAIPSLLHFSASTEYGVKLSRGSVYRSECVPIRKRTIPRAAWNTDFIRRLYAAVSVLINPNKKRWKSGFLSIPSSILFFPLGNLTLFERCFCECFFCHDHRFIPHFIWRFLQIVQLPHLNRTEAVFATASALFLFL